MFYHSLTLAPCVVLYATKNRTVNGAMFLNGLVIKSPVLSGGMSDLSVKARNVTLEDCGGAFVMVSDASRSTELNGLRGVAFLSSPLTAFQQRLVELAAAFEQPVIGDRGMLLRRRYSGAVLWKAIVRQLREEGHGNHNWRDIEGLLEGCEEAMRKLAVANKEALRTD